MNKQIKIFDKLLSFFGIKNDITPPRLSNGDELSRNLSIFNNYDGIVYYIDTNYRIHWANSTTLSKYPNAIGKKCHELFSKNSTPCPDCFCVKAIESGQVQNGLKFLSYSSDKIESGYWENTALPVFDSEHNFVGALSVSNQIDDITNYRNKMIKSSLTEVADKEFDAFIKENYKAVFDSLHIPFCITGNNLKINFYNEAFLNLIGLSDADLQGEYISKIIVEVNEIGVQKILSLIVAGVEEQSYKINIGSNNHKNIAKLKISAIKLSSARINGLIWKLFVEHHDSTDYEDLISSSRFNLHFGVMVVDTNGIVIHLNEYMNKMFGFEESKLIGFPNPFFTKEILTQTDAKKIPEQLELTRKTKDNKEIVINISFFPVFDSKGEPSEFVCLIENKTYLKYIKSEFKDLEERYNNIIQKFEGVSFQCDSEFNFKQISGSYKQLTGFAEHELFAKVRKFSDLVHSDDRIIIDDYLARIKNRAKTPKELVFRIITKFDTVKWINIDFYNTTDEFGNVIEIKGLMYNITAQKEAEEELKLSREEFRTLAMYLETAREEEKKRLALEIHDELGHALTALKLELAWVLKKKFLRQDMMFEKVRKMNELIESTIRKVRSISSDLRPSVLDHFGLEAALEWQASEFQKRSAVRCKILIDKEQIKIDEKTSTAIFRIFQELLNNIAKHAKATRVDVVLEKSNNTLTLKVRDNGVGFKLEQAKQSKSLGLLGMKERANAIGGQLSVSSIVGVGTTVNLIVPINN